MAQSAGEALIACSLRGNPREAVKVVHDLSPECWPNNRLRELAASIRETTSREDPRADVLAVINLTASKQDHPDAAGQVEEYLKGISHIHSTASAIPKHAETLRQEAELRLAHEVIADFAASATPGEASTGITALVSGLHEARKVGTPQRWASAGSVADALDLDQGISPPRLDTGFPRLDECLNGGLRLGQMVTIAARPGQGKTTLALNLALRAARQGIGVAVFSLEMAGKETVAKLLSDMASVSHAAISNGRLADEERARVNHARQELASLPIVLADATRKHSEMQTLVSQIRDEGINGTPVEMFILDYIQLADSDTSRANDPEHVRIGAISSWCKQDALEHQCIWVTVAQLNRDFDKRENSAPRASDIKGAGAIEQDSDIILMLAKPGDDANRDGEVDIHLVKARTGQQGKTSAAFMGGYSRIAPMPEDETPPNSNDEWGAQQQAPPKQGDPWVT